MLIAAAGLILLASCSREKIFDNTTDAVVFVGSTAVKGVFGASRLVVRGAAAGAKRLQRQEGPYPPGTIVCFDDQGALYAAAVETEGKFVCPDPPS
ncbi:hypothetical protein [Yoonia sp. 2307UL14-13]|uniref:hypothetical protein n=1 Tax=Yoonia sp. 2307UL14-13 TaxID=3126506 RepID=UPI003095B99B